MPQYIWNSEKGQIKAPSQLIGFDTLTATRDPTSTDDVTQGWIVGSEWFNASVGALRSWTCVANTAGAAQWEYGGAVYASGGTNPPTELTQFGASTATIAEEGNIYREVLGTTGGRQPSSTGATAYCLLGFYNIPASAFDGALLPNGTVRSNRGVNITAMGSLGANGDTKRILIMAGGTSSTVAAYSGTLGLDGTVIADTGSITVNGSGWSIQAEIFKYGAAASNTQLALHQQAQAGPNVSPLVACQNLTLNEAGVIPIAIVASCTTLASDVQYNFMEVNAMD
jgi:hypothetical protein